MGKHSADTAKVRGSIPSRATNTVGVGLCFLNTLGLQMDADVLAVDLGYSCFFVILMMIVCLKSRCN